MSGRSRRARRERGGHARVAAAGEQRAVGVDDGVDDAGRTLRGAHGGAGVVQATEERAVGGEALEGCGDRLRAADVDP